MSKPKSTASRRANDDVLPEGIRLQLLPGYAGGNCPWDRIWLMAHIPRDGKSANLLRRLPKVHVLHKGRKYVTVIVGVDKLAEVVATVGSWRRPREGV